MNHPTIFLEHINQPLITQTYNAKSIIQSVIIGIIATNHHNVDEATFLIIFPKIPSGIEDIRAFEICTALVIADLQQSSMERYMNFRLHQ